jgi:hypothetical protein
MYCAMATENPCHDNDNLDPARLLTPAEAADCLRVSLKRQASQAEAA